MNNPMEEEQRLVKCEAETDPAYGCEPNNRPLDQYINYGVINLDKPAGPSSHQVVAWVKSILHIAKAGHGGTLDPNVTGVLPTALGESTRAVFTLLQGGKEYVGVMRLHGEVSEDELKALCHEFETEIYQYVPLKSAVKRQLRTRTIYKFEILEFDSEDNRNVLFHVSCQAGTYIRTLIHDIGEILGIGAHMRELRRIRAAGFYERDAVTLHQLKDVYEYWRTDGDERGLRKVIQPMEETLLSHLPKIIIRDSAVSALCHGAHLTIPGIVELDTCIRKGDTVAILTLKGEGVAIGRALLNSEELMARNFGFACELKRVLMPPDIYPRCWRRRGDDGSRK